MAIYSYYYGANPEKGIGIQAQSAELQGLPLASELKELASLHALESSEHSNEMMAFMLERDGYSILGVSYTESPKASGYNRSAPCSLQYIAPMQDVETASAELSRVVNFVCFQKPVSSTPMPLNFWPMNESGYLYHNSESVLAPLVDGLARVALSNKNEVLLIALPKGKNSEYAFARYTMAEMLTYLPVSIRKNIRFFTGLPVAEGISDPTVGFSNAVRLGANVVFCPNEYYSRIKSYYTCIGVNMEAPESTGNAFGRYVTKAPDASGALSRIESCLSGVMDYNALNNAAQQAAAGKVPGVEDLRRELDQSRRDCKRLEQQIGSVNRAYQELKSQYNRLEIENQRLNSAPEPDPEPKTARRFEYALSQDREEYKEKGGIAKKIALAVMIIALLAGGAVLGYLWGQGMIGNNKNSDASVSAGLTNNSVNEGNTQQALTGQQTEKNVTPTDNPDEKTSPAATGTPTDNPNEKNSPDATVAPTDNPNETKNTDQPGASTDNPNGWQQTNTTDAPDNQDPGAELKTAEQLKAEYPNLASLLESDSQPLTMGGKDPAREKYIVELQKRLNELGYKDKDGKALISDGIFYAKTKYAVETFQEKNNVLEEKGQVGKETIEKLLSPDAVRNEE